jgi:glycosyltransferase involved in cell wall biosynthesis
MFVYNNCAADQRVLKEATTLVQAGHTVQIVAVLDKDTIAREERDGFTIVRIARDPVHYKVLRTTRRVRRWLRLTNARIRRRSRLVGRRFMRLRTSGSARKGAMPSTRSQSRRGFEEPGSGGLRAAALLIAGLPGRAHRYGRWRLLQVIPPYRRWFYKHRSKRLRKAALRAERNPSHGLRESRREPRSKRPGRRITVGDPRLLIVLVASVPYLFARAIRFVFRPLGPPLRFLGRALRAAERRASHYAWRLLMRFHKPLMFTDYYWRTYRLVKRQEFDVYHAHDLNTLPVAAALARSQRSRLVYDSHELYTEISTLSRLERRVWKWLEPPLIRRADNVLTVCDSIADELATRYGVKKPLTLLNCPRAMTLPNGGPNKLRQRAGLEDSAQKIVLYQGGFAPNRGLPELVEAARYLEDGVVVLMGWGRLEEYLKEKIESDGLKERVVIVDRVAPADLLSYTLGADVGVIPYRAVGLNNYYTTPNKLFEYMAAGIAVAGSRFPEVCRFVEGNEMGVTFDPDDPRDMASAINWMLRDESGLRTMKANAREAGCRFVWETESLKLLKIYSTNGAAAPFTDSHANGADGMQTDLGIGSVSLSALALARLHV